MGVGELAVAEKCHRYLWQDADNGRLCGMVPGNSMAVPEWLSEEGFTNSRGKKKSKRQERKGEIYTAECRLSEQGQMRRPS